MPSVFDVSRHLLTTADRVGNEVEAHPVANMETSFALDLADVAENASMGVIGLDEHEALGAVGNNHACHKHSCFSREPL